MAAVDLEIKNLFKKILEEGREYENVRRGVKRLQIPSYTFRHDLSQGFPALTNKHLYWKGVVGELIWFLRGDNDVKYLNDNGIKIWNPDAHNWHKKNGGTLSFEQFSKIGKGSVGQNYSKQWRDFNGDTDQIADLISGMKEDIMGSRLKVNAWNPSETDLTALPPCHSEFQVIGVPLGDGEFGFELHWNQRSVDTFLGLPFNIASYGLLAKILEYITGYKALAIEGTLKCVHFYDNQYEAAKEMVSRDHEAHPNCELNIVAFATGSEKSIDHVFNSFNIADFKLAGYTSDESIKVDMIAPKQL